MSFLHPIIISFIVITIIVIIIFITTINCKGITPSLPQWVVLSLLLLLFISQLPLLLLFNRSAPVTFHFFLTVPALDCYCYNYCYITALGIATAVITATATPTSSAIATAVIGIAGFLTIKTALSNHF